MCTSQVTSNITDKINVNSTVPILYPRMMAPLLGIGRGNMFEVRRLLLSSIDSGISTPIVGLAVFIIFEIRFASMLQNFTWKHNPVSYYW